MNQELGGGELEDLRAKELYQSAPKKSDLSSNCLATSMANYILGADLDGFDKTISFQAH